MASVQSAVIAYAPIPVPVTPACSVVILTHNGLSLIRDCIRSVTAYADAGPSDIVVVDNGSSDGSGEYLATLKDTRLSLISLSRNVGIAAGRNMGLARAAGRYILFTDNDTVWHGDAATPLLRVMDADPSVGVAGMCGVVMPDYASHIHIHHTQLDRPTPVDAVTGYCFMVRRSVVDAGLRFDERYAPYGAEDIDFCLSARHMGYRCVAVPGVPLIHAGHGTSGAFADRYARIMGDTHTELRDKWLSSGIRPSTDEAFSTVTGMMERGYVLSRTLETRGIRFFDMEGSKEEAV